MEYLRIEYIEFLNVQVYWAIEDTDCCTRNCFGPIRPFDMKVLDIYQNEVIHFYRPLACSSCCFPCCLQSLEVSSPPGNVIGRVEQEWTCWFPNFRIKNHLDETVLRIEGPFCTLSCGNDVNFNVTQILLIKTFKFEKYFFCASFICYALQIVSMNGTEVGRISKQWSGLTREFFTTADYFGINFPMDLDVRMKAVMLGACMLIVIYETIKFDYDGFTFF